MLASGAGGAVQSRRTTIYDVALAAGVSLATVSRVINASAPVAEDTRRRVLQAAGSLGFRPSLLASSLSRRRSQTLGLVVPDIANPFFAELARAVEKTAAAQGYAVFVCNTDEHPSVEAASVDALTRRGVDALILCTGNPVTFGLARRAGVPALSVARDLPAGAEGHDAVVLNDRLGGRLAARYLLRLGHRRIGFVGESRRIPSSENRRLGYEDAMREAAAPVAAPWMIEVRAHAARGVGQAADDVRAQGLSAVCVATDAIAWRLVHALRLAGLAVPEGLSVVSFDDTEVARLVDPPLTSVRQPIERMGRLAVETLLRRAVDDAQGGGHSRRLVRPSLIVRGSALPLAGG
jgi:DNA-binding LacI/PurR family transcriptional regulator